MLKDLWELFYTFAKVGVMTFGGGYAMLPILQREVVEKKGWATDEELTDYFAIGQCTPGVIAVNTATFIGQKHRGVAGGIVATLGVVFPSLIIISALAKVITAYAHFSWVQHAFAGIRVCVCVLIFNAVLKLVKGAMKDAWCWGVRSGAFGPVRCWLPASTAPTIISPPIPKQCAWPAAAWLTTRSSPRPGASGTSWCAGASTRGGSIWRKSP